MLPLSLHPSTLEQVMTGNAVFIPWHNIIPTCPSLNISYLHCGVPLFSISPLTKVESSPRATTLLLFTLPCSTPPLILPLLLPLPYPLITLPTSLPTTHPFPTHTPSIANDTDLHLRGIYIDRLANVS